MLPRARPATPTSFDALLTSIGPQDSEQSTPNFIARGLDFADWSEVAAPRPYAIIATTSDMFPFAGAQATEAEARRFYELFHAGTDLAFITGPGGHGNLRPILPQILRFFAAHLHPEAAYASALPPVTDPFRRAHRASRAVSAPSPCVAHAGDPDRAGNFVVPRRRYGLQPQSDTIRDHRNAAAEVACCAATVLSGK